MAFPPTVRGHNDAVTWTKLASVGMVGAGAIALPVNLSVFVTRIVGTYAAHKSSNVVGVGVLTHRSLTL
jgi:hypothetical protein